jgi:hypothetical protein
MLRVGVYSKVTLVCARAAFYAIREKIAKFRLKPDWPVLESREFLMGFRSRFVQRYGRDFPKILPKLDSSSKATRNSAIPLAERFSRTQHRPMKLRIDRLH